MIAPHHEIEAHEIMRYAARSVGGNKVLAQALGVSKQYIQRQTKENGGEEDYGERSDIERVDQIMMTLGNAGRKEIAYMIFRHFWETYDQLEGEKMEQEIRAIQKEKTSGKPWGAINSMLKMIPFGLLLLGMLR